MERNREGRRMAAANGLSRRRQRSSGLRDSPEEDGTVELQETARLRDRGNKKDRDRDRLSRSKRRRGDRLIHGSNREEGEDSTEESVDDDEEDEDEDAGPVRMIPPNPASSSSLSNHHHNRKNFPPAKVMRTAPVLKAADEMIGVSVPRKARSASVKRSHECWNTGAGVGGEQIHRQASTSPARPSIAVPSTAPTSPPSNASVKKKMKNLASKQRPPKMSKPSSVEDDIEIEVAEFLYGLRRQSHCPSKPDYVENASQKPDWKDTNGSSSDVKSRISSPTSNSPSAGPQSTLPQNSNSSTTPSTAVAPKRKRPRPVKVEEEGPASFDLKNSSSSLSKIGSDQPGKVEASSPKLKNNTDSAREDGGVSSDMGSSQVIANSLVPQLEPESIKLESDNAMDPKLLTEELEVKDEVQAMEDVPLPKNDCVCGKGDGDSEDATGTNSVPISLEVEGDRNEKFQIDLMVPPPLKSSPDRDGLTDLVSDPRPEVPDIEMEKNMESVKKDEERTEQRSKQDSEDTALVEKKTEVNVEGLDSQKKHVIDSRVGDLHLDLGQDLDRGSGNVNETKQPQIEDQQQSKAPRSEPKVEKSAWLASTPLQMTLAGWPGGLGPLGFAGQVPPIPGVMPLGGSSAPSNVIQQPHFLPFQRRPKCATHYYIARNIYYHQQFTKMNPFWPTSAGTPSVYATRPYNLNFMPQTENAVMGNPLPGIFPVSNPLPDKNKVATSLSSHNGKDKSSVPANFIDGAQTKQLVLQQASQPATAANLLPGPAFIFPLSQQQAAAATQSGPAKSASSTGNATMSIASTSASGAQGKNSVASGAPMSFSYPNLPQEAQYMAVLQNNGYPFPVPSHVGGPPNFRGGPHAQAIPFFNGSFCSSQGLHPSQTQQQQPQPPNSQQQPVEQGHQNMSTSSGSSSSQKHQQNQQQRLHGGGSNGGAGSSHLPSKNRPQLGHNQNMPLPHNARLLEAEMGGEESPSTADSRVSHLHKNIYYQNFTLPLHPQNFLMSPAALAGSVSGNASEKPQQSQQQQGMKGVELIPSQAFAMSFAAFNGGVPAMAPGLDFSSMAQNHAIFQSLPEAARRDYQAAAAASQAVQQSKTHQISEEGKVVSDSMTADAEKKVKDTKGHPNVGQSLVFSRPDSTDPSLSAVVGNPIIDGSPRTLNLITPVNGNRASSAGIPSVTSAGAVPFKSQQQQQVLLQLQKQQQQLQQPQLQQLAAASVPRTKQSAVTNANAYSDRLPVSTSMSAKFPNTVPVFPQALMHGCNPPQNPQWKQPTRTMAPSTPSSAPTTASSLKNLSQQQSRTQQGLSQISFGVSPKSVTSHHGQQLPTSNPSPSPPLAVGSPSASVSKSAGGSPRTTSSGSRVAPSPALSSQQSKNSQSGPSRKSSPVGGRSVPSILGNTHVTTTSCPGSKLQSQQQQQQQQLQKQTLQQAQFFFSNAYMQAQSPLQSSATPTTTNSAGYYNQRRQPEQQQQQQISSSASTGLLCPPLASASASTADPTKAIPAAPSNVKGVLPLHAAQFAAHSAGNSHPLMSTAFSYMHTVPAVPVKPAEHKQPAGNDNLRASWQPEKS